MNSPIQVGLETRTPGMYCLLQCACTGIKESVIILILVQYLAYVHAYSNKPRSRGRQHSAPSMSNITASPPLYQTPYHLFSDTTTVVTTPLSPSPPPPSTKLCRFRRRHLGKCYNTTTTSTVTTKI